MERVEEDVNNLKHKIKSQSYFRMGRDTYYTSTRGLNITKRVDHIESKRTGHYEKSRICCLKSEVEVNQRVGLLQIFEDLRDLSDGSRNGCNQRSRSARC